MVPMVVAARRFALAGVVAALALLLPWSTAPANAWAGGYLPPVVTTRLAPLLSYYGLPAGVAAEPMTVIGAGVGAYQGTCMVLEWMIPGDTTCDAQAAYQTIVSGNWNGSPPVYVGSATIIGHSNYAGRDKPFPMVMTSSAAGYCCMTWSWTYVLVNNTTGAISPGYVRTNVNVPAGMREQLIAVEDGNDPNELIEAWNLKYLATGGTTTGSGFLSYPGAPSAGNHYALSMIELKAATAACPGNVCAHWETGVTTAAPHTLTVTETCKRPDGSTFTASNNGSWTPVAGEKSPKVTLPNCWDISPGSVRVNVGTDVTRQGGGSIQKSTQDTVSPLYPSCSTTMCELTPKYLPTGVKCYSGPTDGTPAEDCTDQWPDSRENKKDWECWYGPYRVALGECLEAYPRTYFDPGVESTPGPEPSPSASPTVGPSTPPIPTTGTNPETPPQGNPSGDPQGSGCWGSGWSWNPISWVYVPTKCVLQWAFVPTAPPAFDDIPSPLPSGWVPTFPALADGSCGALVMPSLDLGNLLPATGSRTLLNTCNAPWPLVRGFTYYGLLAGVLVTVGNRGFRAVMTALGMSVDTPSSGGGDE